MATGSVDRKNTYVFEVLSSAVVESVAKTVSYWSTGNGDDTMVTLWNPADEAQDFTFTLSFSGGHYRWPIRLEARATRMFNVSEIIHNQIPDAEGNLIPATIFEGSAEVAGSQGENQHILVAMDAATYNVQKATCGTWCITCQGVQSSWLTPDPFSMAVGASVNVKYTLQWNSGKQTDDSAQATWKSSDQSVATVSAGGLVKGVAGGETAITASDDSLPDYFHACYGSNPDLSCPQSSGAEAAARGTVGQCFARLLYRPVEIISSYNHSFWWIHDAWGTDYIIDGGPQNTSCPINCGYLNAWVVAGTEGHYQTDNSGDTMWYDSGLSVSVCPQVDNLETYAFSWSQTAYKYCFGCAPNSAYAGGFPATAPPKTVGW